MSLSAIILMTTYPGNLIVVFDVNDWRLGLYAWGYETDATEPSKERDGAF